MVRTTEHRSAQGARMESGANIAAWTAPTAADRSIRRHLWFGGFVALLVVAGIGGWASVTSISGAVIAPGQLVVDTSVKKVQHPTGGVVGELRVREGDRVQAGDILVRLEDTQTRASLAIVTKALDELAARQARDEAERDGASSVDFPSDLLSRATTDDSVERLIRGEKRLFAIREAGRAGQKAQLAKRIEQLREEIVGLTDQASAKTREIDLVNREFVGVRDLFQKNLVSISRVIALERDTARIEGERGQLVASIAQAKTKITETELQIIQIDQDLRTEVGKDLAEIRAKISELSERKISAEDQLRRVEIRAPQQGIVHQLSVHTIGGVIAPSDALMLIVPEQDALVVETRIQPQDIDNIRQGQQAVLRFSAFNQRMTPEVNGIVERISADVSQDQKTGQSYYTARIVIPDEAFKKLNDLRLVPGMPAEAFIQTGVRTIISYLTKPMSDQISRAWRER